MFHNFGARCLGKRQAVGSNVVSRGTCTDSDPEGDQIFSTFEARATEGKPFAGTHVFVGGTGKYAGFTGTADYTVQPVKSSDGTPMFSVPHKAKWQIAVASEQAANDLGQQLVGTAADAKAMLEKAVAAVKADKAKALEVFNKGEGGFRDRDLYVFCDSLADGKVVAIGNPNAKQLLGQDIRLHKDAAGKAYGAEIYAAGQKPEGQFTEVSYVFPRPGADKTPVPKISLVTNAGDLGCGVGYYKPAMAQDMALKVVEDTASKWTLAYNANDAHGIAALFTPDGVFLPASAKEFKGRDEIEKALAGRMKAGWTKQTVSVHEAHAFGDIIWATGEYTLMGSGDMEVKQLNGLFGDVFVKDGDGWRLVLVTANAAPPKP